MDTQLVEARALLLKAEASYGVDPTPAAATDGILVLNGQVRFRTDPLERQIDKVAHGARSRKHVRRRVEFSGGIELQGNAVPGTAAPIGPVLRACGFAQTLDATPGTESAVYSLVTSGYESFAGYGYDAGELIKGLGVRGVLRQIELSVRNFAQAQYELLGLPTATPVEDQALPAVDYSTFVAPDTIETESFEVDIGGVKLNALSVRVDGNAQVAIYEGSESRFVFPRSFYRPSGVIRVYKDLRSTWNPETKALTGVQEDVYATITGGSQQVRLDLGSCEFGTVEKSEEEGLSVWDIPFFAVGATATDCLSLSFRPAP